MAEAPVHFHCEPEPELAWLDTVFQGDGERVAQLLAEDPGLVEEVDDIGRTALHLASYCGHDEIVAQLLTAMMHRSEVDAFDYIGWTALHYAALNGHHEVVEQLLAAGCKVNVIDDQGRTALYHAVAKGHELVVAMLTAKHRTEINERNYHELTALCTLQCGEPQKHLQEEKKKKTDW